MCRLAHAQMSLTKTFLKLKFWLRAMLSRPLVQSVNIHFVHDIVSAKTKSRKGPLGLNWHELNSLRAMSNFSRFSDLLVLSATNSSPFRTHDNSGLCSPYFDISIIKL